MSFQQANFHLYLIHTDSCGGRLRHRRHLTLISRSAKQRLNPCSGPSPLYQDLSARHDWPVEKVIVDSPIRMKGNSKHTSVESVGGPEQGYRRCFAIAVVIFPNLC